MTNIIPLRRTETTAVAPAGDNTQTLEQASSAEASSRASSRTFHFWRGTSRKRYVHIVHSLLECPEVGAVNYVLVRIEANGTRTPLRVACASSAHGSENLAEIRQHAARTGASEVHLHVLADTAHQRAIANWDLQTALFGVITSEGVSEAEKKTVGA